MLLLLGLEALAVSSSGCKFMCHLQVQQILGSVLPVSQACLSNTRALLQLKYAES